MMPMIHGMVNAPGPSLVEIIESALGSQTLTSATTKTATVTFSAAPSSGEVLVFLFYRAHLNSLATETPPSGLTLLGNVALTVPNPLGYSFSVARAYVKTAGASESSSYAFSYTSSGNGLLYVRGYRLANATTTGATIGTRTLQVSITSQVVPTTALDVAAGAATFVLHAKSNTATPSINNSYVSPGAMYSNYVRVWHKINDVADATADATVSWTGSTIGAGYLVEIPFSG